ncbi:MAG: cytochrome c-type biogenesis protein CcmH [Alphaproteobacteria bacterium]|nr:cytochrome c-type biogenesis protein CcmH [Alphaproteobacteria bacterium]
MIGRLLIVASLWLTPVLALDPGEALSDGALETRARALSQELRCLVCQNQSIDDSDAPLARDLRQMVRLRLVAGDSDAQIRAAVVERYGEFALFRPRLASHTAPLWAMPIVILLLGGFFGFRLMRQNTSTPLQ